MWQFYYKVREVLQSATIITKCDSTAFLCATLQHDNQANNAIKLAKKLYVSDNLEANKGNLRKTWNVINELTSRNSGKVNEYFGDQGR